MQMVFISYSRVDGSRAMGIRDQLERHCEVFLDLQDIPVSVPWFDEIQQRLRGAALMLALDTASWRSSENCQAEAIIADRWLVPILRCDPEALTDDAIVGEVIGALAIRTAADDLRSELFVRAGNWTSLNHSRSQLVGGRTLQRYSTLGSSASTIFPTEVHEYLGVCRRAQRRRHTLRTFGVLGAVILALIGIVMFGAFGEANRRLDDSIVSQDDAARYKAAYDVGPYAYLDALAQTPDEFDGGLAHHEFARALSALLPETVQPAGDAGNELLVPPGQIGNLSTTSPDGRLSATATDSPTIRIVDAHSKVLIRRAMSSQTPSALAWSPYGTEVAAAVGRDIELLDVRHGTEPVKVRGAPSPIDGIAFVGDKLNAHLTDGRVITWPSPVAGRLPRPTDWIMDAKAIPGTSRTAVLGRDGTISMVDSALRAQVAVLDSGIVRPSIPIRLAVSPLDKVVAVATATPGQSGSVALINVESGDRTTIPVAPCSPTDLSFDPTGSTLYLACLRAGIGKLDLTSRKVTTIKEIDLGDQSMGIVSVNAAAGRLVAGTNKAQVVELDPQTLTVADTKILTCAQSVTPIQLSHDGTFVYHGGASAANTACDVRGNYGVRPPKWNRFMFPGQDANQVHAVAVSPDDKLVAFGFSDGSVWIFDALNLDPTSIRRPFYGDIRGLAFDAGGASLLVASRDGDVSIESTSRELTAMGDKRRTAQDRVEQGRALGLY